MNFNPLPASMSAAANDNRLLSNLGALLAYRNRPQHFESLQSNWATDPAAASAEPEIIGSMHTELALEITPTPQEVLREMGKDWIENERGQVVAIGRLRFSDGTQTERAYKIGPDGKAVAFNCPMPAGAMLGTVERVGAPLGGKVRKEATVSNVALEKVLGAERRPWIPGKRQKRSGKSYTARQSGELIAEAMANTHVLPPVTKCPPGVAAGTPKYADAFVGLKTASTGKGGAIAWEDIYESQRDREQWLAWIAGLDEGTITVLKAAITARNFTDVGLAAGQSPEYARRKGGRRALQAANDNLAAAIKKIA